MALTYMQIDALTDALIANARALIFEAQTLQNVSAFARAYALAHLAREELSKCTILYAAATRMLAGVTVDWKKTMRRLRDHKAKLELETGAQLLLLGEAEKIGALSGIVDYRNDRKNASLYVGFVEGKAVLPVEVITEEQASQTIELAKFALELQTKTRETSGPFASRTPGPIPGVSGVDNMNAEQFKAALKAIVPLYQTIVALTMSAEQSGSESST